MQHFHDVATVRRVNGGFWNFIHQEALRRQCYDGKTSLKDDDECCSTCSGFSRTYPEQHHETSVWRPRFRGDLVQRAEGAESHGFPTADVQLHELFAGDSIELRFVCKCNNIIAIRRRLVGA